MIDSDWKDNEVLNGCAIECDAGWLPIVAKLCTDIQNHIVSEGLCQTRAVQIKEKFGALRFYVDVSNDHIEDLIDLAEHASASICEVCGEAGKRENSYWIKTLCEKHRKERA